MLKVMTSGSTPGKPCAGKLIQHKLVSIWNTQLTFWARWLRILKKFTQMLAVYVQPENNSFQRRLVSRLPRWDAANGPSTGTTNFLQPSLLLFAADQKIWTEKLEHGTEAKKQTHLPNELFYAPRCPDCPVNSLFRVQNKHEWQHSTSIAENDT